MKAGDAVWVRRDRGLASSWQIRKVLAVNPLGEPTHTGPWNSSLEEELNDKNTLEYQQIGAFEEIPQEEQKGLTVFSSNPEVTDRLYTEQEKRKINELLAILCGLKLSNGS